MTTKAEAAKLDTSKVKAAIDKAQEELNGVLDATYKTRKEHGKLNVMRTLDMASKALDRAVGHLVTANEQFTKKDVKPGKTEGQAPAAAGN